MNTAQATKLHDILRQFQDLVYQSQLDTKKADLDLLILDQEHKTLEKEIVKVKNQLETYEYQLDSIQSRYAELDEVTDENDQLILHLIGVIRDQAKFLGTLNKASFFTFKKEQIKNQIFLLQKVLDKFAGK